MYHKHFIPIEAVSAGDIVWAEDPESGEQSLSSVVQTFENETEVLVHVTVEGNTITSTPHHPFYSPVKGWTDAADLRAGDILVRSNGEYVIVEQVQHEILESPVKVYNFEVQDYHTYYVGCREVLVHNWGCGTGQNGIYEGVNYHGKKGNSVKSKGPNMGQQALDNSVPIGKHTTRRIGISDGEFVVLDETSKGVFHGHVRSWKQLTDDMRNALKNADMVTRRGKIKRG